MTILDIELVHFGKFHQKKIKFSQGLNIVYGKNEAGKSTIHAFIQCMLFGMEESDPKEKRRIYKKYFPLEDQGGYGGTMRIRIEDHVYRIERSFLANSSGVRLFDETEEKELAPAQQQLKVLLEGLTETNYVNTVSIRQPESVNDPDFIDELERFVTNTSKTKNIRVDMKQALDTLEGQKQLLEERYLENAEESYESSKQQLEEAQKAHNELLEQWKKKEKEYEALEERLAYEKREGTEEMLDYDRRRESCRLSYEQAKRNLDNSPEPEKEPKNSVLSMCFFLLTLMFAGGIAYLYFVVGIINDEVAVAIAGFSVAFVLCLIGMIISMHVTSKRRKAYAVNQQIRAKREQALEMSLKRFEACKQAKPSGYEQRCNSIERKLDLMDEELDLADQQLRESEEACKRLEKEKQQLYERTQENVYIEQEIKALELALETLKKVGNRVQETFGSQLFKDASAILAEITGNRYDQLMIGIDNKVQLGKEEKMYSMDMLSRGTLDQIYLAVRIAAAKLLWQKSPMPFILDDIFSSYDEERLEAAMNLLKQSGHQVIIFSSSTREDRFTED